MAKDVFWVTVTFGIIVAVLTLVFLPVDKSSVVVVKYDCTLANTSPDYPQVVKDECRKREK